MVSKYRSFHYRDNSFTGYVVVVYDDKELLVRVFFDNCDLDVSGRVGVFQSLPLTIGEVRSRQWLLPYAFMEAGYRIGFEEFWKLYNKKVNRLRAEGLWNKLSDCDTLTCVSKLDRYLNFLRRHSWRTKQDPDTFLRNRSWESEWE